MACIGPLAGIGNILTEILFLRSKNWWKVISWFWSKPNQTHIAEKPCKTLPCFLAIFRLLVESGPVWYMFSMSKV